jgi:branched-chain amino acid transport system substrate-binding protein
LTRCFQGRTTSTHTPFIAWILLVVCVLVSPPVSSQTQPEPQPSPKPSSFAIGVAVPLSGEYAPLGKQVVEAVEIAATDTGVRVVTRDTLGTPVGAITAIDELAKDDTVLAVIGPIGRRESRAAAQVAQRVGMPMLSLASTETVNHAGNWVYRLRLTPAEQAAQLAESVRTNLGDQTRVGIFFPKSKYGREASLSFATRFRQLGGKVNAVASYAEGTSDFRKPVDALVGERVFIGKREPIGTRRADTDGYVSTRRKATVDFDLLFIPDYHQRVARMLPFFPAAGIQTGEGGEGVAVQMLGLSAWQGSSMELTGAHAAGAIFTDTFAGSADGGRSEDFAIMFEGKTGRQPVNLDVEVFDGAWLVGKLIGQTSRHFSKDAGDQSNDSQSQTASAAKRRLFLANQLPRDKTISGVGGEMGFGARGEPLKRLRLYQFDIEGTVTPWR